MISLFKGRHPKPEQMDDFGSDLTQLHKTLFQFEAIGHWLTRNRSLFKKTILNDMRKRQLKEVHLIDIGCGGGDFARWAINEIKKENIRQRWTLIDHDPRVVEYTKKACAHLPEIKVVLGDWEELCHVRSDNADYITAFHFLHHLSDEDAVKCVKLCEKMGRYGILMNDLNRSRLGYYGFSLLATILFRSSFALKDGKQSILNGFSKEEWEKLFSGWSTRSNGIAHWSAFYLKE